MNRYITEPERKIPIIAEADLCVAGGSCTGLFAAIRAARLGLQVVLIERGNMLGGTAVQGLVNVWHSTRDTDFKDQVIAGLTQEVLDRLAKQDALNVNPTSASSAFIFSPWELAIILDQLVQENRIRLMLHSSYTAVAAEDRRLQAIIVENADGRGAIQAKFFIDATGDGRIARDLGLPAYESAAMQPPSACFHLLGDMKNVSIGQLITDHGKEFGLDDDWGWSTVVPGCPGITMRADSHVFGVRCHKAEDLTKAELEGRRLAKAFLELVKKYGNPDTHYTLTSLCSRIGIRDTLHFETAFQATEEALLTGKRYDDPIINGTYRVDIHHLHDNGITFRYLDGREETLYGKFNKRIVKNWRHEWGITTEPAKYYQVPYEILVNRYDNFIAAGRMIHADDGAFGALRVMVNLNQMGEAAGVAAALCVSRNQTPAQLSGMDVTKTLRDGGSAL